MQELIADLPLDDRPREKMRRHGAEGLSNAELISLLLGSGTRGKNAIQLARELLRDGLGSLGSSSADSMAKISGVGLAKATRIGAAFEIARRLASSESSDGARYDDAIVARALISRYGHESQEHLGAVLLDSRHRVLKQCEIYVGTVSRALVSTRDVVRVGLEANAVGVVLFHNHPSGDPSPSAEDLTFTKRIQQSLSLVDIELVDHLIVGAQRYCSMRTKGLLQDSEIVLTTVNFYRVDEQGQLFISPAIREWAPVADLGIDTVIDLDAGLDECIPTTPEGCLYIYFPIYDEELPSMTRLDAVASLGAQLIRNGHRVLSHCGMGFNRSALVAGVILNKLGVPGKEIVTRMRERRPGALFNDVFANYLASL